MRKEMIVEGIDGDPVTLTVYAETDFLAVTRTRWGRCYRITHKPTGLMVLYPISSLKKAKDAMKKIAGLEWDFGHHWSFEYKATTRRPTNGPCRRTLNALRAMRWFKLKQEVEG